MSNSCKCPKCGQEYSGTDRSGGHCIDGCHQSFGSMSAWDKHRVGPFDPPGQRRCLTPEEMTGKGWHLDDRGAWRLPAPKEPIKWGQP